MIPENRVLKAGETVSNGTEVYEVVEQLPRAQNESIIYRVCCKTGRLRNRHVALKKLSVKSAQIAIASIHQALHHPNIVSLLSVFSTNQDHFHVLELCTVGSILQFLNTPPKTLSEPELRIVAKSLADALTYLRKELVVHCDINPSNILLTGDYGLKLSDFKHAVRLPCHHFSTKTPYPTSSYIAPEIASGGSCNFSADIWSLGCVLSFCLTGRPPFEANAFSAIECMVGASQPVDHLPQDLSPELKILISHMLQIVPENRIYIPDILAHPFLSNDTPFVSLRPLKPNEKPSSNLDNDFHRFNRPESSNPRPLRHATENLFKSHKERRALMDIGNLNLSDKVASFKDTRRIVSDPARLGSGRSPSDSYRETPASPSTTTAPKFRHTNLARGGLKSYMLGLASDGTATSSVATTQIEQEPPTEDVWKLDEQHEETREGCLKLPVGTERPTPLNTLGLSCQLHKTVHGQIHILPSRSLLVDFRESQRRKGCKGNEVLLIEPDGLKISTYNAPHLSLPSLLVEATQTYSIQTLPSVYWKQYNDVARLVDQIKQRTPTLVAFLGPAKCSLMANAPNGDIEILLTASAPQNKVQPDRPFLRMRLSRQNKIVEIARHISDGAGEEWRKRSFTAISQAPYIFPIDLESFEQDEKEALHHLTLFVKISDTVEQLINTAYSRRSVITQTIVQDKEECTPIAEPNKFKPDHKPSLSSRTPTIKSSFSSFSFAPRPSKLSTVKSSLSTPELTLDSPTAASDFQVSKAEAVLSDTKLSWREDTDMLPGHQGVQTRFIPSIGWCIRHASTVSQGGRYMLMFLDGATLDIDVDEEWVKFKSQSGEITMYNVREGPSTRKIGERMKAFQEFVSLFDDSQVC